MPLSYKIRFLITAALTAFVCGCAATTSYLKLDPSLQKDMKTFSGAQYIPLARLCEAYDIECKWDAYINTATIQKRSDKIVLRAGSGTFLSNGVLRRMERPVVLSGGTVFVPVSFAAANLGPFAGARPVVTEAVPVPETPKRFVVRTIALDAGHGGKDAGATGRRLRIQEKEMALMLARKVKVLLENAGIRVIMTRDSDAYISLPKRARIANRSGADIFVSVHLNASRSRLMRGFECYYLSNTTDDNARALEALEDSSLKLDKDAAVEHSRRLDRTLWDMSLTENRAESAELAGYICDSVENSFTIGNRGVRSARFYVLKHTHMPSVLVEAGYISNRYEEARLKEPDFLDRIAEAIAGGILAYKKEYERTEGFSK